MAKGKITLGAREKWMIIALVVVILAAAYYFIVYQNIEKMRMEAEAQLTEVQSQVDIETARYANLKKMEAQLESLGDLKKAPELKTYDNIHAELRSLNTVLAKTENYNVTFDAPVLDGELVRRTVTCTYEVKTFDQGTDVMLSIIDGTARVGVTDVSMREKKAGGTVEAVQVTLVLVYYETIDGAKTTNGLVIPEEPAATEATE